MIALCYPKKNEEEFVLLAERLGYKEICFIYDESVVFQEVLSYIKSLKTQLKIYTGLLNPKNIQKARQSVDLIFATKDFRFALEKQDVDIIFNQEIENPKDSVYQRQSGLNHILCSIAEEKQKIVGLNFSLLLGKTKSEQAKIMGRFAQNIFLCKKYKTNLAVFCFAIKPDELRSPNDLFGFFLLYGLSKNNNILLLERIKYNQKRRNGKIIARGVEEE